MKAKDLISVAASTIGQPRSIFSTAYYGSDLPYDWCGVWTWYVFDKAGMGDQLFGNKAAAKKAVAEGVRNWVALGKKLGTWHDGYGGIAGGDIVIFDWEHNGAGNHVCIVESVSGSVIQTIEGNGSDPTKVKRYSRSGNYVMGYLRPSYDAPEISKPTPAPAPVIKENVVLTALVKGVNNKNGVKALQMALNEAGSKLSVDGDYGNLTAGAVQKLLGGDGTTAQLWLRK